MAVTFALVNQGVNSLRYLITATGAGSVDLTTAITADNLLANALAGPLNVIGNVVANGLGQIPAGAASQAQARAYYESDNTGANIGTTDVPRAIGRITPRDGVGCDWLIDGNAAFGNPGFHIVAAAAGHAYLDVVVLGAVGR